MTTATAYYPATHSAPATRRGDPTQVAVTIAMKNTGLWDAFEFRDRSGQLIHIGRANLKAHGTHWRIHHGDTTYIISYDTPAERINAARKVQKFLLKNVQWNTMKLRPECALDYWQDAPSHLVVL